MQAKYDLLAPTYKEVCEQYPLYCKYIGGYTFFQVIGDVTGKTILDFGCGEGTNARIFKQMGAKRVVGVDISQKMLELAKEEEAKEILGIEYIQSDMCELEEFGSFELGVSFSVLSSIPTKEQLLKVFQNMYANLKPQGHYVTFGFNPDSSRDMLQLAEEYSGTNVRIETPQEGAFTWVYTVDEKEYRYEDYLLGRETYEWALRTAGFKEICWHQMMASPEGDQKFGNEFLQSYINYQTLFCLECFK